jgi:lipopolysaccharide transport system permease protein
MKVPYLKAVWDARYFWVHLALSDLRSKWRRSFFGALWSMLQPLFMTLMLSFVLARVFKLDVLHYAPYILSGMVVWEYVVSTATSGALAFVQADAYIKQCRHPLAIYTLRTALANLIVLMLASVTLLAWVLVTLPGNIAWAWLGALLVFPLVLMQAWPLATLLAYIGVRFRDLQHALGLVFQALWFVSPIYFEARFFQEGGLGVLVDYNPVYHLLEIVRAPLLKGTWPTLTNYAFVIGSAALLGLLAWLVGRRAESKVIFYL